MTGGTPDPSTAALLDRAAAHSDHHEGPMRFTEEVPGDFWAIECVDVHKTFGRNQVLRGLNVGIPTGMITIVLGPSGTGKSVLIKHLIGLLFPDRGDVLVHGQSVPNMTLTELLEMRKRFGILFQDGALFGSMSVYDNVAFPLRQHTDFSEGEIREIVMGRLGDVGLAGADQRQRAHQRTRQQRQPFREHRQILQRRARLARRLFERLDAGDLEGLDSTEHFGAIL